MGVELEIGFFSLLPVMVALTLAFVLKDAVLSLLIGCVVGVVLAGYDPVSGAVQPLRRSLGNEDFIWVMLIELPVGTLIAFYIRVGAMQAFTAWALERVRSPRAATGFAWILGVYMDHVTTQLPYALLTATFAGAVYLLLGYYLLESF